MRPFLLVLSLLFCHPSVFAAPADGVVHQFFDALSADDERALESIITGAPIDDRAWVDVQALISAHQCITATPRQIVVTSSTGTSADLRVTVDVTALKGAGRHVRSWSGEWLLTVVRSASGSGRVRSAETLETHLARSLVRAAPEQWDGIVAAHPHADWTKVPRSLSREAVADSDRRRGARLAEYALHLARLTGDRSREVEVLGDTTLMLATDRKNAEAVDRARQALAIARDTGDSDTICGALFVLGMRQLAAGKTDEALEHLLQSAAMAGDIVDTRYALHSLTVAARLKAQQRDQRAQMELSERLAALSAQSGFKEGEIQAALSLGDLHVALQNHEIAATYFGKARALAEESRNRRLRYVALCNLGDCELRLGRVPAARKVFEEAVALAPEVTAEDSRSTMMLKLADALVREGRLAAAEKSAMDALPLARKGKAQPQRAAAQALLAIARIRLLRGDPAHALDLADTAQAEARHAGATIERELSASLATLRGRALRARGRHDEAIAAFETAIAAIEEARAKTTADPAARARIFAPRVSPYHELADVLVERGRAAEAAALVERTKARALLDAMDDELAPPAQSEKALDVRIAALNRGLTAAGGGTERSELRARLAAARLDLQRITDETRLGATDAGPGLAGHRDLLALPASMRETTVVQYLVTEARIVAFVIRRGRDGAPAVRAHPIAITRAALEQEIDILAERIEQRSLHYRAPARKLYDLLVEPVAAVMRGKNDVAIIPDGPLWRVPFHALVSPRNRFLTEEATLFYAPSLSFLRETAANGPRSAPAELLALGNPKFHEGPSATMRAAGDRLAPLREAEREVREIARLYDSRRSRVLTGAAAREEVVKQDAGAFRVLHFAAHGLLDAQAPLHSALVLSPSPDAGGDDGLLEGREVLRLRLQAQLAVLSGCDTGRGRIDRGEGVVGLAWAFLVAGCPTTVVSQWSAESASTATLMIEFHRQLVAGEPPARALRAAQRHVLGSGPEHPFYWAPFVVVGAGR